MTRSIHTLAGKDLRLLLRDARSAVILLLMPLLFVGVLGMAVGEGFGQKPDDRLRISVVNLDEGLPKDAGPFPPKKWSEVVIDDFAASDIRIELIPSREEAERLVRKGERSAVLVFEPQFSDRMHRCSFITEIQAEPINPLYRDGIDAKMVGLNILKNPTQLAAASIIEQATQVTLVRVVIPWMIGKAFERVGDAAFMKLIAELLTDTKVEEIALGELAPVVDALLGVLFSDAEFGEVMVKEIPLLKQVEDQTVPKGLPFRETALKRARLLLMGEFRKLVKKVFDDPKFEAFRKKMAGKVTYQQLLTDQVRKEVGPAVQKGIEVLFRNYDFRAKTWAGLTKSGERETKKENLASYHDPSEGGLLGRGALRYQILVPGYTVMFAFFLVLTTGWLFVAERRQGTLIRLRAAPLTRGQILLGKLVPCMFVSLCQGFFLLIAGKLAFGMSWGTQPLLLIPVVICTSLAASGLAMLVAGMAKTETQVAVYGTLLVLVLAGVSGSIMPRDLMPEEMRQFSYVTPHAWALDAYAQLLLNPSPEVAAVWQSCAVLLAFGAGFLLLAWWLIRLD